MSETYVTPTSDSIAELLGVIFGEDIDVTAGDTPDLGGKHTATFIDDDENLVAACVCDLDFVAYSGASLSMIPADVANEMIAGKSVTDAMLDNFYEVMNICSKLLMSDTSAHLRLDKTLPPDEAAAPIAALQAAKLTSFGMAIPKYGKGTLTFVVT